MNIHQAFQFIAILFCLAGCAQSEVTNTDQLTIHLRSINPETKQIAGLSRFGITQKDFHRVRRIIPEDASIVPIRTVAGTKIRNGKTVVKADVVGTIPAFLDGTHQPVELNRGRNLEYDDLQNRNNVVVVSQALAEELFAGADPIGKPIMLQQQYFTIVGVLDVPKSSVPIAFMPLPTMRSRLGSVVLQRNAGSFQASHYELSELRINMQNNNETAKILSAIRHCFADRNDVQITDSRKLTDESN